MALNRNDGSQFEEQTERVLASYANDTVLLVHQYQTAVK
jgi:hypothetical protein